MRNGPCQVVVALVVGGPRRWASLAKSPERRDLIIGRVMEFRSEISRRPRPWTNHRRHVFVSCLAPTRMGGAAGKEAPDSSSSPDGIVCRLCGCTCDSGLRSAFASCCTSPPPPTTFLAKFISSCPMPPQAEMALDKTRHKTCPAPRSARATLQPPALTDSDPPHT